MHIPAILNIAPKTGSFITSIFKSDLPAVNLHPLKCCKLNLKDYRMKKLNYYALLLMCAGISLVSCENTEEEITSSEITEITGNMTLSGNKEYLVNQNVYLDNAELTIEPGCTIKFGPDGMLTVGYTANAAIIANGTAEKPIVFKNANAGSNWKGLRFYRYSTSRNVLKYCTFDKAGRNDYHNACIAVYNCEITMFKCTIENSSSYGIYCEENGGFENFDSNLVRNCASHPLRIDAGKIMGIGNGNSFVSEGNFGIEVLGQYLDSGNEILWEKQSLPYFVEGNIEVSNNSEWTIEAGTVFKMKSNSSITIGSYDNGGFTARGTIDQPIVFTSAAASPSHGSWDGIHFNAYTMGNSTMEFCEILYGGYNDYSGNITFYGSENHEKVTIRNCRIAFSGHYGVYFGYETNWTTLSLLNLFDNNQDGDIYREE